MMSRHLSTVFDAGQSRDTSHIVRVGTTEGRFRMVMPELLEQFHRVCPDARVDGVMAPADQLRKMLENGELDLVFSGLTLDTPDCIDQELLFDEHLYLVISEEMARGVFPDGFEAHLNPDADLGDFTEVPFCKSLPHLHCMQILEELLDEKGIRLQTVHVSAHFDLHQELAIRNYAACFTLTMYVPHLYQLNKLYENQLHICPVKGLRGTNPVFLLWRKDLEMSPEAAAFARLLKGKCAELTRLDEQLNNIPE